MKKIYVSWTYLDTIEVPENASDEEIEEILDNIIPEPENYNDRDWSYANEK